MIKEVKGNILKATEDVIVHQVNSIGIMGGGLALQIKNKYPEVYVKYKNLCDKTLPENLLGRCQVIKCHDEKYVANLFGQLNYGRDKQYTDYEALKYSLMRLLNGRLKPDNMTVALPYKLGCGLAGGDWNIVYNIIVEVFGNYDVTIYNFE